MADLEELFRWLHRHPELAFAETGATSRVKEILTQAGLAVQDGGLPTGLVALVEGAGRDRGLSIHIQREDIFNAMHRI